MFFPFLNKNKIPVLLYISRVIRLLDVFTNIVIRMDITPDLPYLNILNTFTNERISVYLDTHSRMSLDIKNYFVKPISHLSKGVVYSSLSVMSIVYG